MRDVVGPYRIARRLGEGGMGVVYEARDERLERGVALKVLKAAASDDTSRERLRREARAGASVSHPNVCQVYDVGEVDGEVYVAMELLEGESLAARVARGPVPPTEALGLTLGMLGALEALHRKGIVHRDLKPSNVFLTPHGVKLLDFGLALPLRDGAGADAADERRLTVEGTILGTPAYMAPERWTGEPIDPRSDLFALGALLFEMLTGRPAFSGRSPMEVFHAVAYEQPPALAGGGGALVLDRLLQRALAKRPAERPESAAAMAEEVRAALAEVGGSSQDAPVVRTITRLIVLPFRLLRPDPDVEFLSLGLADAVSTSLAGLPSLVVRSARAGAGPQAAEPDLRRLASEVGVDVVLVGTLLRAGERVRVTAQLVEAAAGTILWSETTQVCAGDVFQLQDDLARHIVDALAIPLSARDRGAMQRDVPRTPRAYDLYLRANQIAVSIDGLPAALEVYRACLAEDPGYAPAWARVGRVHRVMAKYGMCEPVEGRRLAEEAFRRALELNPDLSIAHSLYAHHEVEELGQARQAMTRLLGRALARPSDPELFSGLVLTCRFCGLLDASLAADRRARRLDPGIRTSVGYTLWMAGEYARAMEYEDRDPRWLVLYALPMLGREEDAVAECRRMEDRRPAGPTRRILEALRAGIERRAEPCVAAAEGMLDSPFQDAEGLYLAGRTLARVGAADLALRFFARVVASGFHCHPTFVRDPWLDPIRGRPEFAALLREAEEGRRASAAAFAQAGGARLLGVTA